MSGATNNKDGTRKRWIHGRAVQDGKLRFLSVSSLEKGDSSKPTGCLRRWWYQYIGGIKESQSKAMETGEKLHAEIAHYLTTGEQVLSSQALMGLHMIPEPGPDLLVEHDVVPLKEDGSSGIDIAPLRANGVPIVGAIDLIHHRGINRGDEELGDTYDPEGTVEVIDFKTCRTLANIKKGPELLKAIQMSGYGKYVFETVPEAELVRLSHIYFPAQGTPKKTTILVDREKIEKSWEHANRVASSIGDAAKETNPDLVEANTNACNSYGRACPAIDSCAAAKNRNTKNILIPTGNLTKNMSIFSQIKRNPAQPTPNKKEEAPPSFPESSPTGVTGDDKKAQLLAELARLEAAEKSAKAPDMPELLPPDAPESNPILASLPQTKNDFTNAIATVAEVAEEAPKKRGRKPKAPVEAPPVQEPVVEEPVVEDPVAIPVPGKINFYVDCTPESGCESLWPLVDHLMNLMCEEAKVVDIRLSTDGRFEFGRWKGVLADGIIATKLAPGNYGLNHAYSDVALVVVDVMRGIARKSGGEIVMGGR